ncbi:MAG: RIP metalloprotease RseP [Prevotella sp.]|nr:RIP metalloprotease RseP [Prevotella sp.]
MEVFLIRVLQFMLAISLLVLLHEGGHFFFSKLFGVRVDKFYLFFDLGIGKWSGKLFSHKPKNSDTEYGVGWLPLGGYCKISGMIDESFDTEQMKQPEQPWEFRSKPSWQRLLIMIGGVLVNFLLALFIYSMILFSWGDTYIPVQNMTYGMKFNTEAQALGFKDGDILKSFDGQEFKEYGADLFRQISEAHEVTVLRDGQEVSIPLTGDLNLLNMIKSNPRFVEPLLPMSIDSVASGSPAEKAGIVAGDKILSINGHEVANHNEFIDELGRLKDMMTAAVTADDSLKVRTVQLVVAHSDRTDTVQAVLTPDVTMGFFNMSLQKYEKKTVEYGFFESFPAGIKYGWHVLASYVDDMKYVFTADGAKSLGGFGAIGSLFPPMWDWYMFWKMTAFLSIILAFMNILPIPALDGGHVLFLLYEMITRRKPSEQFMIRAEYVGFGIIILLMVVANLNDILRWLGYL